MNDTLEHAKSIDIDDDDLQFSKLEKRKKNYITRFNSKSI